MAEEINVGKLVAEFVLEAETKKAEEQFENSAENIKSSIKKLENTNAQVNVDTKQAEEQVKKSAENIKSTVANINGRLVPITLGVETEQANQQIQKASEIIETTVNKLNGETINVPCKINWGEIERDWAQKEQWISERAKNIQVPVAVNIEETTTDMMLEKIRERLQSLGLEATEVEKIMQSSFSDLSAYSNYEKQLNIIATKLEAQRQKVAELRKEQEQLIGTNLSTPAQIKNAEKVTKAYESESLKLAQLEVQYDRTSATQENYVDKKVVAYQKGVVAAETAAAKEMASQQKMQTSLYRSNTALIFADLTTSLRTFNTVSPGVIYNIGTIVRQLNLLRRASLSGASKGMVVATSVLAVVGTVTTLVVNYFNNIKEKQEEARKKAVELSETYQENIKSVKELLEEYIELKSKLDNTTLSSSEQSDAQEKLISIQNELIDSFGEEAKSIDLVNGKIDEQIEKIDALERQKSEEYIATNYNAYNEAKKEMDKNQSVYLGEASIAFKGFNYMLGFNKVVEEYQKEFENFQWSGGSIYFSAKTENLEDELVKLEEYTNELETTGKISKEFAKDMREAISQQLADFDTEKLEGYKSTIEQYEAAQDIINGNTEDSYKLHEQAYQQIMNNTSAVESLASAYDTLSSGESLDNSKLLELCDTYPELARYIAETGDLSLENGKKVKNAQKEILESNIEALEQDKTYLTSKKEKTAEEEKMLSKVSASLEVYKSQLNEVNKLGLDISDFKSVASELSNAYSTLSDDKQLDLSTTFELIQKYPEFADALNSGSNSIDKQSDAIKKLFEAKKKELTMSLQADKQELLSLIETNNAKIAEYDKLIQEYVYLGDVASEYKDKQAELEENNKNYTNQLNQIKAQISAINAVSVESYKNTENTNEKLQEQLELINHRRAMNNLSYSEEITWLQQLYSEYAKTADERMQLEEKIYTAQQNAIKEQEEYYSELYNTEIDNLEHLKNLDQLSKEQELTWLNTLYSQYVLTAEERMSLEEKIYNVQKEIQEEKEQAIKDAMQSELDLLEHEKNMDRLSAESEIAWLERINQSYEMSTEDRMSLEEKIYNAKKSYEEEIQNLQQETLDKKIEALEKARSCSKITYEEELRQLRNIYRTQKLTLEQQEQLLEQIRNLQSSTKSDRSNQFSTVGEGVVEALKNKYQEQRDLEEKVINDSIEGWKKWEDETVSAIQAQIDALDDLADAQESEDERREYENKRQATELLLKYEKDDYNRQQYIKELNRLDNEEADRLAEEQREQQKKALQAQIDSVKEQSDAQQDLLNAELDAIAENYDKLMSSYSLENEAYKMMLSKSQNEIVNFIASYAPEYELTGQTLGEKLYQGLKSKIQNIDYYFQQLDVKWQWYSNQTAKVANEAVDQFWASRAEYEQKLNTMSSVPTNVNLTVNFNEPVESPVQVARKLEEVTNNLVNQLKQ